MLVEPVIEGRFELEQEVSSGGMGVVFRARDRIDGGKIAVKLLRGDPVTTERFEREAALLADLRHPGIVRYVAHGVTLVGEPYLVMEWLEGEDLQSLLARRRLSPRESLQLVRRTASALAVAHARGVMHRDIKPSNLFLVEGDVERVKLLDFGVARLARDSMRLTQSGVLIGTPGYMAPEQVQASPLIDVRADVFSLGCVLFECLTGRPAFEGDSVMAVLTKIILQPVPTLSGSGHDVPESVERLLARMMAKDPDDRPRDAAELVDALDALEGLDGVWAARRDPAGPRTLPSPGSLPPPAPGALTLSEQRLVSVVLAVGPHNEETKAASALAAAELEQYGGRLSVLADGSMLVTVWGAGSAVDRAERAARCALVLRSRFANVPIHVVTGRGVVSARVIEGAVIDRGVRALRAVAPGNIQVDTVTAGMLSPRFTVQPEGTSYMLRGERILREGAPLLLGKVTPCVGRSREMSMLGALFLNCVEESTAGAALVIGPAGSGKSRLRKELVAHLKKLREQLEVLSGQGDSLAESSPFGLIADAIRGAAGIGAGEPLDARRQKLTRRLGRHLQGPDLTRVAAFLGEMIRAPFPDDDQALRAARDNPMLMGDAMRAAWEDWITAECQQGPVLLVLDDLHWGDAATVQLIDATLRNLRDLPFMVLVLARPEVHTRFPGLWAERDVQSVKLGPLTRKASEQLVREALGKDVDAGTVARIVDRADGNPFYLEELIRAVAAGRGDHFPDSVLGTVEARLDAEGTAAKRILRAASVFGFRFSKRGVAALLGGEEHAREAGVWLDMLAAHELIAQESAPRPQEDTLYTFRHALVHEAAYATLTEADRALGHRLAGAWLERMGHTDAMAMAEHFSRGGEPGRAVRHYRRAAEEALEANDLTAALERAERGRACGAEGEDLGALRLVEAEAHVWRGDLGLAEQRAIEATELLPRGSAGWFRAIHQVVVAAGKLGGFDRVESWIAPAIAAHPARGAASARIICLIWCATYLIFGGRYAAADALLDAFGPAEELDAQTVALIHQARSIRASTMGDPAGCLEGLRAALAAFEQGGDRRNACTTRANLGFVYAELGDFEGAEESLRSALATADRMGLLDLAAAALHNLGHVLAHRGRFEEARRLEQQAMEVFEKQGDPRMEGLARTYLAKIELLAGDPAAAERHAVAAAEALRAAPPLRASACAVLARALLDLGCAAEALSAAREANALLESLGTIEEGESLVRLVHAEALAANGEDAAFARAIAAARGRLLERAAKIREPTWRERFLTCVPDNARTLSLAAKA